MRIARGAWLVWMAGAPLYAGVLDVTAASTVVVHGGERLSFEIGAASYGVFAPMFGAPVLPSRVDFTLVSASGGGGWFAAALESPELTVELPAAGWTSGIFYGAGYVGPIEAISGVFDLSAAESEALFGGGQTLLTFRNLGGDAVLGLPPYTLRQDLFVSLSGGPLRVGARVGSVLPSLPDTAPEPGSGALLLVGGAALVVFSTGVKRT